jgi:hypothetical protein
LVMGHEVGRWCDHDAQFGVGRIEGGIRDTDPEDIDACVGSRGQTRDAAIGVDREPCGAADSGEGKTVPAVGSAALRASE